MASNVSSLSAVMRDPVSFWNLEINDSGIQRANFLGRVFNYLASFFSSSHRVHLEAQLLETLSQIEPSTEERKKLLEKIRHIQSGCKASWFYSRDKKSGSKKDMINIRESFHPEHENLMQPIFENGRYVNYAGEDVWGQFLETLWLLFPGSFRKPTDLASLDEIQFANLKEAPSVKAREKDLSFYWTGHSTVLLQVNGFNLLFDPSFGYIKPCFTRYIPSPIDFQDLPLIDIVFISHAHEDHCEEVVINQLAAFQPVVVSPKHLRDFFTTKGFDKVHDLTWWETREFTRDNKTVKMTSIPAKHGAVRRLSDLNKHLWHGVVLEIGDKTIYFAGDTAYDANLVRDLKRVYGKIDLAFIPIAPEREEGVHLNCEQSLQFFEAIGAEKMFPIHFGSYRQSSDTLEHPYEQLLSHLSGKYAHLKDRVMLPIMGRKYGENDLFAAARELQAASR